MEERSNGESKAGWQSVVLQLMREMWMPFFIAVGWTIYSVIVAPEKRNPVDTVTIFGGAFFLACWAFAQWFRVKKQQTVEIGLGGIISKQEQLVDELQKATDRLIGHASGGNSVGWLMFVSPKDGRFSDVSAMVYGDYPLIEARAHVIDLDLSAERIERLERSKNIHDYFSLDTKFNCGLLQPNLATLQNGFIPCDTSKETLRYRVDWTARNGKWEQFIQLKLNGDRYSFFTAVKRDGEYVFENPKPDKIILNSNGLPDVFWYTDSDFNRRTADFQKNR